MVALDPLTNSVRLFLRYLRVLERTVRPLVVVDEFNAPWNATLHAESNFYGDLQTASKMLSSGFSTDGG